jgi:putative transposase
LWSWDITKLLGPATWTDCSLDVILDVFSRDVVGWMVADREAATLAERLLGETVAKQHIGRDQLTVHADRGSSMTSKPVAFLLADLGVTKTHSRPHVSNDNCYAEAQFKTLKSRPGFPDRFGSIQDARAFCQAFFTWYNRVHRHSGIAMMTPGGGPLRPRRPAAPGPRPGPHRGLHRPPRTVRPPATRAHAPADRRVDQPTPAITGHRSVINPTRRLRNIDRLRARLRFRTSCRSRLPR